MTTIADRRPSTAPLQELVDGVAAGLPGAMVSVNLVWHGAVLVIASKDLPEWIVEAGGVPLDAALCAFTVRHGGPLIIDDTHADAEHSRSVAVTECGVRSYAGVPLHLRGELVGTLVALHTEPAAFTAGDLGLLADLAPRAAELLLSTIWR